MDKEQPTSDHGPAPVNSKRRKKLQRQRRASLARLAELERFGLSLSESDRAEFEALPETRHQSGDMFGGPLLSDATSRRYRPDHPVSRASDHSGPPCHLKIREFLSVQDLTLPRRVTDKDFNHEIGRAFRAEAAWSSGPVTAAPRLGADYRWAEIREYAEMSADTRRSNKARRLELAIHALSSAFRSVHPTASCRMVSDFWRSVDVREYIEQLCELPPGLLAEKRALIRLRVLGRLEVLTHPLSHTTCKVASSADQLSNQPAGHSAPDVGTVAPNLLIVSSGERALVPAAESEAPPKQPRRHGFLPDMARHRTIAAIVERHVPDWKTSKRWCSHSALKLICPDLDEAGIEVPDSWRAGTPDALGKTRVKTWTEALDLAKTGKKLVADQIRTSLAAVLKSKSA